MPKLSNDEIEAIDKALTKTWSLNRMESDRYQAKIRNNTYRWLTELVAEVKELRAKAADPTPPVQPDTGENWTADKLARADQFMDKVRKGYGR